MQQEFLNWFLSQYPNGRVFFDSGYPGKKITIIAGTHGDEWSGIDVLDFILSNNIPKNLQQGSLQLIIANIEALKANKRYADHDLNRIWWLLSHKEYSHCYEHKRANEMMQFLQDSDIVIDLHSTSKPSTPMLILGSKQIDQNLLQSLDIEYIIQNIFGKTNGLSSLEYIESQNNNTICMAFESGQHNTETTKRAAIYNCQTILGYYGLITKQDTQIKRYRPKQLQVDTTLYSKSLSDRFLYSKTPKSFDTIPKNNPIVQLGNNTIHAPYDCYILMPSSPKTISEEIGYIAKCI